jgi:hypothetical protein
LLQTFNNPKPSAEQQDSTLGQYFFIAAFTFILRNEKTGIKGSGTSLPCTESQESSVAGNICNVSYINIAHSKVESKKKETLSSLKSSKTVRLVNTFLSLLLRTFILRNEKTGIKGSSTSLPCTESQVSSVAGNICNASYIAHSKVESQKKETLSSLRKNIQTNFHNLSKLHEM